MNREIQEINATAFEGKWRYHEEKDCWYLENIPYVRKALSPELQNLSIFVPGAYRNTDGSWNWETVCGDFTAKNAPVILENKIGGYAESRAKKIDDLKDADLEFLKNGMIYVSPGTRGKESKDENGRGIGKSPAGLVDLKSAVRFLRYNSGQLAGDMNKIVSMGVSAGGAMSSLLGITGDCEKYNKYLEEVGAVMEESDAIFASQCYCPIIDLEHADMAYEWMFRGIYEYEDRPSAGGGIKQLDDFQKTMSEKLAKRYVSYFNRLGLKAPESGEALFLEWREEKKAAWGSADRYLLSVLQNALDKFIEKNGLTEEMESEIAAFSDKTEHGYKIRSREEMIRCGLNRIKPCTSFDGLETDRAENQEFGNANVDFMHFDVEIPKVLEELASEYPEECEKFQKEWKEAETDPELTERIFLLNPFSFIGTEEKKKEAEHFRIRVGTKDPHTSFTMAMILALKLMAEGKSRVDYEMVWNAVHEKADFLGEFLAWVKKIAAE